MKLIALLIIPVVIIFLIAISSLQIALSYMQQYVQEYGQNIFQNQIKFNSKTQSFISFRLTREIYKIPFFISMLNTLHDKITEGHIILNNNNRPSAVNQILLYYSKLTPELSKLAYKNKIYVNSWFQQNTTQIDQLDYQGQQILYNLTRLIPFLNIIQYQSRQNVSNILAIPYQQVNIFTSQEGIVLTNFANSSLSTKLDSNDCYKGLFVYDPRCRFFYLNSLNHTSIFMNPPKISIAAVPPYLSQYTCQMAKFYNQKTKQIENSHIQCIEAMLSHIYDYFQNIIQSSKQYYVIDPRSLSIFFNSKKQYNYTNITQADNFYNIELQYLQDQDQAQFILKYIQDNYNKWVFSEKNNSYANLVQMFDLSQQIEVMDYKRNGTIYKAIFNPVIQYDQIPKIVTKYTQKQGLQLQYAYLQINIISDEELKSQTNQLLSFFSSVFIGVQITLAFITIVLLILTIFLAFQIKQWINIPIIRMKETLEEINSLKEFVEISQIIKKYEERADLILLSKETQFLYQSFLDLFEMIQYTSESFFIENEGKTLISLSKKADFFSKFKNYSAAGVTHNNIGTILLNQEHFFQALEHFSLAIMYAKYEISSYQNTNPDSYYRDFLQQYSYKEHTINVVGSQRQRYKLSISQNTIKSKIHFPRSQQLSNEKKQSYENVQDLTQLGLNKRKISISSRTISPQSRIKKQRKISKEMKIKIEDNQESTFQESIDSASTQQKGFNFWKEIKYLAKTQLKLISYFPELQYLKVFMNCIVSKCYYNLHQNSQAKLRFQEVENFLKNFEQYYCDQKILEVLSESQISLNLKDQPIYSLKKNQQQSKNFSEIEQLQSDITPNRSIINISNTKQQQSFFKHSNLYSCDLMSSTQINVQFQQNQYQESQNSFDTSQKILKKGKYNFFENSRIQHKPKTVVNNEIENKIQTPQSQLFENIQKNQQNKFIETQQNNQKNIVLQTLTQYFQFSRSEYFIFTKKYRKAAEILTDLYESSQSMTSNLPFRIIYRLKQIFDVHKIEDTRLYEEYSRFNKNISFQIIISLQYNCNLSKSENTLSYNHQLKSSDNSVLKFEKNLLYQSSQFQFLQALSEKVLIKDTDKVSFFTLDQENQCIIQNMLLLDFRQFKDFKDIIFDSLSKQFVNPKSFIYKKDKNNIFKKQISNELISFGCKKIDQSEIFDELQIQEGLVLDICELNEQKENKKIFIKDLNSPFYTNPQLTQNILEEEELNFMKQLKFNFKNQSQQEYQINQSTLQNTPLNNQPAKKNNEYEDRDNTKVCSNQHLINLNKEINVYFDDFFYSDNKQQSELQNYQFYEFIRQSIDQLMSNQLTYKASEDRFKRNNDQKYQTFVMFKQFISKELNGLEQEKALKFIIYQAQLISIKEDALFMSLCNILAQFNLQVIISLADKGNSFLEEKQNQSFIYQDKENQVLKIYMESEEVQVNKIVSLESKLACIQIKDNLSNLSENMREDQSIDLETDKSLSIRDHSKSIDSQDNQTSDRSLKEEKSSESSQQLRKKIHKNDEQKKQKRGRKPKLLMKNIVYAFKAINSSDFSDIQSQLQFETNIMKQIPIQKVFFLAGDILAELKGATNQMGIDMFYEQRSVAYVEKMDDGIQIELESYRPIKNFQSVIHFMESAQDQQQYEFAQFLKRHQELVYMISSQIQDLQAYYQFNQNSLEQIIRERKNFVKKQRKQLLKQIFDSDQFSLVVTASLSYDKQITTVSNVCVSKSMMALVGFGDTENICDMFKLGFLKLLNQNSRRKVMTCNVQAQQSTQKVLELNIDNFEITTFDDINIVCQGKFQTVPIIYNDNLKYEQYPLLNKEQFYIVQYDITPWHLERILKLRREYVQKAPQNENFPKNYYYDNFVELEVFEYSIQSQIFLEKFYQKELEKIEQKKERKIEEQQLQVQQITFNNQQCGFRYI
ncbi:hypothetical protein ABPG74_015242 [Tetrahymena malaccensis]